VNKQLSRRRSERRDGTRLRLWPIGWVLTASFVAVVIGLTGLWWVALALLNYPKLPHSKTISLHDAVGVAQLVFASVAGAGALVALVMAYRRQRVNEISTAHDQARVLNERFTSIATQLGDHSAAVRLAGVHALAGLADDWPDNRQTCIDVLCAYLRMPFTPEPSDDADPDEKLAFRGHRESRLTVIRLIAAHLQRDAAVSWQGLDFDFSGVIFDGGDFGEAVFSDGMVKFDGAEFRDYVIFVGAEFCGAVVRFDHTIFSGEINFRHAEFRDGLVVFTSAKFPEDCFVSFENAVFSGTVHFGGTEFAGGEVIFDGAQFTGEVIFSSSFSGSKVSFRGATFSSGEVRFGGAVFSRGEVCFPGAKFAGTEITFSSLRFPDGRIRTPPAEFTGASVDFSEVAEWSHPPALDWEASLPQGVEAPTAHQPAAKSLPAGQPPPPTPAGNA
jgi:uncharacterized protein YjbI with pentapeptide repeats